MRNRIALFLLFLDWPVCVIHRAWNNAPYRPVRWILLDKTVSQDFRWYWVWVEWWVSGLFMLISFMLVRRKTRNLEIALWANFCISIVDIVNYLLWFRRNELMLTMEGLIMLAAAIIIIRNGSTTIKSHHEKAT